MRICYLADAMSPHTRKWARHFAGRGHEVHVISFRNAQISGCTVHHIQPPFIGDSADLLHAGRSPFQKSAYLLCARSVRRLVKRIKPDILHALLATSYGLVGALSGFHPFVISSLGSEVVVLPETSSFYRRLVTFNLARADAVSATSRCLSDATARYCPGDMAVATIPFGVDTDVFSPVGRSYSDETPVVIGTVKILEANYGIDRLIQAFEQVIRRTPDLDISLLIVGGGSMEEYLRKLGHRLGVASRVTFVGNLPHRKVPTFFDQIDIFVSLPESETFGVSVVEASACGIPVVASDVGGLPEVVAEGETGFLVPPADVDAAASRILELAADSGLRRAMGAAGRSAVESRYDWNQTAPMMEDLYERAVLTLKGVHA